MNKFGRIASLLVIVTLSATAMAERPSVPRLFPESTVMLFSVVDAPDAARRLMNTSWGRMSQDPQMRPLFLSLYGSALEAVDSVREQIGLSLPELLAIPQGELTVAMVTTGEGTPKFLGLFDAGDQIAQAAGLIELAEAGLQASGAVRSEETVLGTQVAIYDIPNADGPLIYFVKDGTIVASGDYEIIATVLAAWNGGKTPVLADNPRFASVMRSSHDPAYDPQAFVFVDPINFMRAMGREEVAMQMTVAMLPVIGLDGLDAVGGNLALDTEDFDTIFQAHVQLDSPRDGVLEIIALKSGDVMPEPWVPDDVSNYVTGHVNVKTSFEAFREVFDGFRGEGALSSVLERRFKDTIGLDLEADLLPALSGRVSFFNQIKQAVPPQTDDILLALEIRPGANVTDVMRRFTQRNAAWLTEQTHAREKFYRIGGPNQGERPPGAPERPTPCLGLLDGYLVVTSRVSMYEKAIDTSKRSAGQLAESADFLAVLKKIRERPGGDDAAMIAFGQPKHRFRMIYGLATGPEARQQMAREAENDPVARAFQKALTQNALPPFSVLEKYLAPSGMFLVDDTSGIHLTRFSLGREEAEEAEEEE